MLNDLDKLAFKYGSDKCPQIHHPYTPIYFDLFNDKRGSVKKILEIGVGSPELMPTTPQYVTGASLYMWQDFFHNAKVYGADIVPELVFKDGRIETFECDQNSKTDLEKLIEQTGADLDIVIDDGQNSTKSKFFTCLTLMPLLKKDVIYIIEDVRFATTIKRKLSQYDCQQIDFFKNKHDNNRLIIVKKQMDNKFNDNPIVVKDKLPKTSIIIPSRNEFYEITPGVTTLQKTVADIYAKARGDFEVIVGFDGPPYQEFPDYPNFKTVNLPATVGLKIMTNMLASMATGKYIYKTDAHCMFGEGFNEILASNMQDNWVVTPRFYVLNAEEWKWQDDRFYDYFYLSCPLTDKDQFKFKAGGHWPQRTKERLDPKYDIDETPQMHGSGWFVDKEYFFNSLGGFPNFDPMGHAQEPPYLGLKSWLGPWGGKLMVNKKTWYAHMHKGAQRPVGYSYSKSQNKYSYDLAAKYWMGNKWAERTHDIEWLIDKFMPMPTWPENWKELYKDWLKTQK